MEFSLEFYRSAGGSSPVEEFLAELKRSDPHDYRAVMSGLARLQDRVNHRPPLSKPLGGGLFELRHVGKLNSRVFYFFMQGRSLIAVHAIRNKGQKIPKHEIDLAESRMKDWIKRAKR